MAEAKIDPEIRIRPSVELQEFIRNYVDEDEPEVPKSIFKSGPEVTLSISDVTWIRGYMSENQSELKKKWLGFRHFHEMMEKCVVILPEPVIPPRNPELEARIQKLKAEQAEREYKKMTYNISGKQSYTEEPLGTQMRELNSHLIMILQFVVSVATAFVFGYLAPYFFYGTEAVGPRLLLGVVIAFVVAIADLYFVIRFLLETEGLIKRPKVEPDETENSPSTDQTKADSGQKPKLD